MTLLLQMIFLLFLLENTLGQNDINKICGQTFSTPSSKIIGGSDSSTFEVPWQVSIHFNKTFLCGGSILDKWWILTASHCFRDDNTSNLMVYLALENLDRNKVEKRNVSKLIRHPSFNKVFMDHDIALILLSSPIEFSQQKVPICLTRNMKNIKECFVSGWGSTKPVKSMTVPLKKAKLKLLNWNDCHDMVSLLTENMICAWEPDGKKDSCQGDSGGPLFCQRGRNKKEWYQIGIISWGQGCGKKGKPGMYTAVSNYLLWIVIKTREAGQPYIISASKNLFAPPQYLIFSSYFSFLLLQKIFFSP